MSGAVYRAVLFDLFGTLVTFEPRALPELVVDGRPVRSTLGAWRDVAAHVLPGVGVEALARALAEASAELDAERGGRHLEFPSRERFRRALARLGVDGAGAAEAAARCARAHMRALLGATRFPAAHAAVLAAAAARGPVAIVTNFDDTATAHDVLARHDIRRHVAAVVVSDAVGLRKPHPALVRLALEELGVAPADAVLVGDHPVQDVGAAAAAGVDAIWIDRAGAGVAAGGPVPRWVVRSLVEVPPLLG